MRISEFPVPPEEEREKFRAIVRDPKGRIFSVHFVGQLPTLRPVRKDGSIDWKYDHNATFDLQHAVVDILEESDLGVELRQLSIRRNGNGNTNGGCLNDHSPLTRRQSG